MSIDEATPEEWNEAFAGIKGARFYDNRSPKEVPYAPIIKGYDSVEKPMHYDGQVECIEYIRDRLGHEGFIAYCWGSVIKYQHRWKEKGGVESLRKARWFLNRLIQEESTGRFDGKD